MESIIPGEQGILSKRGVPFHSSVPFARENLFCALWGDEFYILNGSFEYQNQTFEAKSGDVVFLDCKIPQHYWALEQVRFQYLYFGGNATQAYWDMLSDSNGVYSPKKLETSFLFGYIIDEMMQSFPDDNRISFLLHNIISILAVPDKKNFSPCVKTARQYIHNHFREPIMVADIAACVSLSQYSIK